MTTSEFGYGAAEMAIADDDDCVMKTMPDVYKATTLPSPGFQLREEDIPGDVIVLIMDMLQFQDVLGLSQASKNWLGYCNRFTAACFHYPYNPKDDGSGQGLPLDLSRKDWKAAVLSRELHANQFERVAHEDKMRVVFDTMCLYNTNPHVQEEGLRWLHCLFDVSKNRETGSREMCEVPGYVINQVVTFAQTSKDDPHIQQLAVKVLGMLALQENNRKRFGEYGTVQVVTDALRRHAGSSLVVSNCCWALVIMARPLGALEGSTFHHTQMRNTNNIEEIVAREGIELVMTALETHHQDPGCLAKGFWSLVNMSLFDGYKDQIIGHNGIQKIIAAMRSFPDNIELQYRACFALINLCIKIEVKDMLRDLDGIPLILAGMDRFTCHLLYQRCTCVVLRSLAWNSDQNGRLIRELGGERSIRAMMTRFESDSNMVRLGHTTLDCLLMPPAQW